MSLNIVLFLTEALSFIKHFTVRVFIKAGVGNKRSKTFQRVIYFALPQKFFSAGFSFPVKKNKSHQESSKQLFKKSVHKNSHNIKM